jgi:FkbM family methyltransferase
MTLRAAPLWIRVLTGVARHAPRGRYWIVSRSRWAAPPFVARLGTSAGGARFACELRESIAREACLTGSYEPPVTDLLRHYLGPGGTMVDAGANWGYFTLVAASLVGPSGHVLAIEPDPRAFARLARNIGMNGFPMVQAWHGAVAARSGRAMLTGYSDASDNQGLSRLDAEGAASGPRFETVTAALDDLVEDQPRDLVKVDVEGAELDVLEGMTRGLAAGRYRALIIELHPALLESRGESAEACVRRLQAFGYRGWTIDLSPAAYRRGARRTGAPLLQPLESWRESPWPHTFWLAPGQPLA